MRRWICAAAVLAATALALADAQACGRRGRGGGGCSGGGYAAPIVYAGGWAGGCQSCGIEAFGAFGTPIGAPMTAWSFPTAGFPARASPLVLTGASGALTAGHLAGQPVLALDPTTGQWFQVGTMNANGSVRSLNQPSAPLVPIEGLPAAPK